MGNVGVIVFLHHESLLLVALVLLHHGAYLIGILFGILQQSNNLGTSSITSNDGLIFVNHAANSLFDILDGDCAFFLYIFLIDHLLFL